MSRPAIQVQRAHGSWLPIDALIAYLGVAVLPLVVAIAVYLFGRAGFISMSMGRIFVRDDPFAAFVQYAVALAIEVGIIVGLMRWRKLRIQDLGLQRFHWGWIFAVLGLYIAQMTLVVVVFTVIQVVSPSTNLDQAQDVLGFGKTHWAVVASFIAAVGIAPVVEELIFRGIMFRALASRWPIWLAAIVSSAAFGWLHGQLNVGIYTFLLGLLLTWLFQRSQSLFPGILLHMLNNAIAFWFILQIPT